MCQLFDSTYPTAGLPVQKPLKLSFRDRAPRHAQSESHYRLTTVIRVPSPERE